MQELFRTVPQIIQTADWNDHEVTVGDINYFSKLGAILKDVGPEITSKWGVNNDHYSAVFCKAGNIIFFTKGNIWFGVSYTNTGQRLILPLDVSSLSLHKRPKGQSIQIHGN